MPVTLPLTRGYVNGFEVFYISTEASDKGLANHLTNFTHSRVSYTPALANAPPAITWEISMCLQMALKALVHWVFKLT